MAQTAVTIVETQYNVWELGPWSRIVDCRTNKQDAATIAEMLTQQGRFTHIVTIDGSQYDRQLRVTSQYNK